MSNFVRYMLEWKPLDFDAFILIVQHFMKKEIFTAKLLLNKYGKPEKD